MKIKVVYVDDEQMLLDIFEEMFGDVYDVRVFSSSVEALEEIRRCEAEVVISDLAMPEVNGFDLLSQVSRICPRSYRVLLTGFGDAEDLLAGVTRGAVHKLVAKPLKADQLRALLVEAVEQLQGTR
jgi:two-component system, NtrC family, response regulator HupR/HoxA